MMHFTLKIRWTIFEDPPQDGRRLGLEPQIVEESNRFIPAALVSTHAHILSYEQKPGVMPPTMETWEPGTFQNYLDVRRGETERRHAGRLIEVVDDEGKYTWYLASFAWLLGPNGATIERIAP